MRARWLRQILKTAGLNRVLGRNFRVRERWLWQILKIASLAFANMSITTAGQLQSCKQEGREQEANRRIRLMYPGLEFRKRSAGALPACTETPCRRCALPVASTGAADESRR